MSDKECANIDAIVVGGDLNVPTDGDETVVVDKEVHVKGDLNL